MRVRPFERLRYKFHTLAENVSDKMVYFDSRLPRKLLAFFTIETLHIVGKIFDSIYPSFALLYHIIVNFIP